MAEMKICGNKSGNVVSTNKIIYLLQNVLKYFMRHGKVKWHRVTEACVVAAGTATIGYLMMFGLDACIPIGNDSTKESLKFACKEGEYNSMAAVWLKTPKQAIRSMLHDPPHSQNKVTLAFFVVGYFLVSTITFGLSMSIGLFLPNLLTGAAWGRLLGSLITSLAPPGAMKPAKYALIGAAAQLGGVVRMTISLTVIIMEATGQIFEEIPIMITLLVAKWTGDYFNESIYELHIKLAGIPYIEWEPPPRSTSVYASHIMSHPALCVSTREKASIVMDLLHKYSYNGFPVVKPLLLKNDEDDENNDPPRYRKLRGLILRSQLVVLLQKKMFNEYRHWNTSNLDVNLFSDAYPVYPTVDEVTLTDEELNYTLDLQPFMNPTPYTVPHNASLPRLFRLFRALGLRHLPIVNQDYEVVGMVTRKDIAFLEE